MRKMKKRTVIFTSAILLSMVMTGIFCTGLVKADYTDLADGGKKAEYAKDG